MDGRLITGIAISAIVAFHLGLGVGLALRTGSAGPPPPQILCEGGAALLSGATQTAGASVHLAGSERDLWADRVVEGELFVGGEVALGMGLGHAVDAGVGDTVVLVTPDASGTLTSELVEVSALMQIEDAMADRHCALVSEALARRLELPEPRLRE